MGPFYILLVSIHYTCIFISSYLYICRQRSSLNPSQILNALENAGDRLDNIRRAQIVIYPPDEDGSVTDEDSDEEHNDDGDINALGKQTMNSRAELEIDVATLEDLPTDVRNQFCIDEILSDCSPTSSQSTPTSSSTPAHQSGQLDWDLATPKRRNLSTR